MNSDGVNKIVRRLGGKAEESTVTAAYYYLERSKRDRGVAQNEYESKEREAQSLEKFIEDNQLWYDMNLFSVYLDEGAEQKVFIDEGSNKVIKLNDAIFYVNWSQYFESIIVHNILFPATRYELLGFLKINTILFSVVSQSYVRPTAKTDIGNVKEFMIGNGFNIKKNNDYIHNSMGLIIEDLHEENVLTADGVLFFIDTVIYVKD